MPKISDLTESSAIDGSEHLYAVQANDDRRLTPEQLADYVAESYVFDAANTDTTTVAGKLNALTSALTAATNLLPEIYPVGCLYWSTKDTSPASLFGGTWTRIQDRFVLGASNTYVVNSTGGEATHTLTVEEMPEHDHGGVTGEPSTNTSGTASPASTGNNSASHTHKIPTLSGTAASNGEHTHSVQTNTSYGTGSGDHWNYTTTSNATGNLSSAGAHTHTVTTDKSTTGGVSANHTHSLQDHTHNLKNHTHTITANGNGGVHNNMPPYKVFYCWERTV